MFRSSAKAHDLASADLGELWIGSAWCCEMIGFIVLQGSQFVRGKLAEDTEQFEWVPRCGAVLTEFCSFYVCSFVDPS